MGQRDIKADQLSRCEMNSEAECKNFATLKKFLSLRGRAALKEILCKYERGASLGMKCSNLAVVIREHLLRCLDKKTSFLTQLK